MAAPLIVRPLLQLLGTHRFLFRNEVALHEAIEGVLTAAGVAFERERVADAKNRFDFWVPTGTPEAGAPSRGVVIEVKVDDSLTPALRQVTRYLELPGVAAVILAATPAWARNPPRLAGAWSDRIFIQHLQRSAL